MTSMLLSFLSIFPAAMVLAAPAGPGIYKVTTSAGLNVRSGPDSGYVKTGGISYGATFTVTQTSGSWGYVPSYNGWVHLDYAQIQSSNSSTKSPGIYKVTASSGLNVRSGPNVNNARVNGLSYGHAFTVTQVSNGWGYVPAYGGWVSLDYAQYVQAITIEVPPVVNTKFTPRTTAPDISNKYYLHTSYGGLNSCILGSNQGSYKGSALPNCVGYAWGRAYEITGKKPALSQNNASTFWGRTSDGYARGQTPKAGAIVCWSGGSTGAGHVAVIESVSGSVITISESMWSGSYFKVRTGTIQELTKWLGSSFTFQGYIYILG